MTSPVDDLRAQVAEALDKASWDRFAAVMAAVGPLVAERDAAEASRRDWAAEAARLSWIHEAHGSTCLSDELHPRICACVTDDQATRLGPGFTRPVCSVHPAEGGA